MNEVPIQISKEVLQGLNPSGKYLIQVQKGGCTPHIYNPTLAKRPDMFILDIATGRPETVRVQGGEVTESIVLKDNTFHVDPSLKVVLDEIAEDYEAIQSRLRVFEEENTALLQDTDVLNHEIETLTREKEELIAVMGSEGSDPVPEGDEASDMPAPPAKYSIKPTTHGWYDVVENNAGEAVMNTKKLRKDEALELIGKLESEMLLPHLRSNG